jgi:DNA primase
MGLERQIMRTLIAFPVLADMVDDDLLGDAAQLAPDGAEMLGQLVGIARSLGEQASFASVAELLRATGSDYDTMIAEVSGQPENDLEIMRLDLAGALRQVRTQTLKAEADRLVNGGLRSEEERQRWRDIMQQLEQLRRKAEADAALRLG